MDHSLSTRICRGSLSIKKCSYHTTIVVAVALPKQAFKISNYCFDF